MHLVDRKKCSGCHACFSVCPEKCIAMEPDKEGFLQPVINQSRCVECGACRNSCPALKNAKIKSKGKAYACINKDEDVRENSSSGGVFTLIAEYILDKNGVVFGAAFDEKFNVHHIPIKDKNEIHKLRGSKYVQSSIGNTFKEVKSYLKQGVYVLFTGTPCQISGLKAYLKKDYDTLFTQDLICHGVPSPKVWQKYIDYCENKFSSKLKNVSFRSKQTGWKNFSALLEFENGEKYNNIFSQDLFMTGFLKNISLRLSCYNCLSKSLERESDITLADFWGIEKINPKLFDDKGTSLVFINSSKGQALFDEISKNMVFEQTDIDEAVVYNSAAYASVPYNKKRRKYFKNLSKVSFDENILKCTKISFIHRVKIKIKKLLKGVLQYVRR